MFRHMILSWFGCGMSPRAPGTIGSLGSIPLGLAVRWTFGPVGLAIAAVLLFFLGWGFSASQLRDHPDDTKDPQWIVVDEVVGQWLALAALPFTFVGTLLSFVLFRFFDIVKPWPVSWADRKVPGGLGIMLDDVFAGLYAALIGIGALYGVRLIWAAMQ